MRGLFLIISFLLLFVTFGQNSANVIVLAEDSTKFWLEIDGASQLDSAWYNYKITGVEDQSHNVKVKIQDGNISVEKVLFFQTMGVEATLKLVQINGEYKLRYFGEVSMGAALPYENQVVTAYKSNGKKFTSTQPSVNEMSKVEKYSFEMQNESIDVTDTSPAFNTETNAASSPAINSSVSDSLVLDSLAPLLDSTKVYEQEVLEVVYNYSGEKGCSFPDLEADELIAQIEETPFSSKKITIAKNGIKGKCLTAQQVEKITSSLAFEDERLAFVKYAYQFTYDKTNYKSLIKLFNYSSTKSDFLDFVNS